MIKRKPDRLQTRLGITAAVILLVGLGSAVVIYLAAPGEAVDGISGYEPENSKLYMHDLELYGGKANVLAAEFSRWFAGLWQGRSLAYTVACIAIAVSAVIFWVARNLPSDPESDARDENERGGSGHPPGEEP